VKRKRRGAGRSLNQGKTLNLVHEENARLRQAVMDLTLDKRILLEVSKQKLATPALRRAWVSHVISVLNISERRACRVLGQNRSTQRKRRKPRTGS